jgi:hypothetical protein
MMLDASYTLSREMDNTDTVEDNQGFNAGASARGGNHYLYDFDLNRRIGYSDIPHRFVATFLYELPFGEGKRYLTDGIAAHIVGGWQLNAYFTAFSGSTMTMSSSGASLNAQGNPQRADEVKPFEVLGGVGPGNPWFDTTSFAPVTQARFGTSKANGYRGPGYANLDASLFRTFRISQKVAVQFRLEALNVTNTPHWANPGNNVNAIDFGQITFTANPGREYDERNLRLGVRVTF